MAVKPPLRIEEPMTRPATTLGRRRFLKAVPAAVAATVTIPAALRAQRGASATPPKFGKDVLKCAEQIDGLQFTDAEEEMAVGGASRNLDSYEELRQLNIPLDTEPAITFRPYHSQARTSGQASSRPSGPAAASASRSPNNARLAVAKPARVQVSANLDDLAFEPVTALASLIESRRITSTDLTNMYLDRLKRYGERLHCVVTLTEDLARAQAAAADREIKAGKYRGPLHGIPFGVKDLFDTKGIRTTWGAKPYENRVAEVDATIVERLREAGGVLVAKLSMGALAQGGVWFGGSTRNPWSPDNSSSGSSAGPGAATAAGLVAFAIGTETRGSIISPSSTCGVVGLRPTYGRVSRYGAMALSWTMDKIGPMCRSVEDCVLVFNAIHGSDGRDDTVIDAPFAWNPDVPLSSLKIGFLANEFEPNAGFGGGGAGGGRGGVNPEEARRRSEARSTLLKAALDVLRSAGAKLEPLSLPEFPANALGFILSAEAAAAFDDLTRTKGIDQLTEQGPGAWPNTFRTSRFIPAVEYIRAQRARTLLNRRMDAWMSDYDVFLSPSGGASLGITNLTGHPAACLKAGFVDGLPQALMITGRPYDEATVLRVALAYERATKWHTMNPPLEENLRRMKTDAAGQAGQAGRAGRIVAADGFAAEDFDW
jgi:Asp-tRNA(Asn)/Glu-tRNA(Gln) amidotransferase A subunit family amidase